MYAFICIIVSLVVLITLLRLKVKIGLSMLLSACLLAILYGLWPNEIAQALINEWNTKPLTQTTGYLFVSLTSLVLLVNVIGVAMEEIGLSRRLVPAMHNLFKSRRFALALIPLMMGMLPTPGGIMLSAPMVREAGDKLGFERSRLAAINYFFRHQWEPVWPLFPAIPLIQKMLDIKAFRLFSCHIFLTAAGVLGGVIALLIFGIPPKHPDHIPEKRRISHNLLDFLHAFWPIVFTAVLYVAFDLPPALGILLAIFGLLMLHKVPLNRWGNIFKAAREPDMIMLIFGALFFKLNLQASGAVGSVVDFFIRTNVPTNVLIFLLPMLVAFSTGVTVATVAISYPFLLAFIGTGSEAKMGLETLAFSGLLFGLWLTPIHLCLSLSASYFQTSLMKIIFKVLLPAVAVTITGILLALFCG